MILITMLILEGGVVLSNVETSDVKLSRYTQHHICLPGSAVRLLLLYHCYTMHAGSSGVAVFSNISSGTHTVRVVASNGGGDRVVERRKVVVMAPGGSSCSAHIINKGLTVLQDAATVEFTAQGRHVYSSCSLDGQSPFPCK